MSSYGYPTAATYQSPYRPSQTLLPAMNHSYPYIPHNPNPAEVDSFNRRQAQSHKQSLARPSNSKHDHSGPHPAANPFLNVHPVATYGRRRMGRNARVDSHSSNAPSLTRSASSGEEDEDLPRSGPNTPYSAKVALWQDGVHAAGPYDEFGYLGKRHYAPAHMQLSEAQVDNTCFSIEEMVYELNERVLAFNFPKHLDLEESANGNQRLAYTSRNKPVLEYREFLERMLAKLDEMPSHGSQRIQESRREAAKAANEQLDQLERMEKMVRHNMHYERWKKTPRIHVTEPDLAPI